MSARVQPKADSTEQALDDAFGDATGAAAPSESIDELLAKEDVEGLIELGTAYRVGAGPVEKDPFRAIECFEAASRLGSEEGEYLVGIAFMNGLGVERDISEGAKRLRSSAQRGSLRAKVYVGNLYEMGVHYAADREKAEVWYRSVARAAGVRGSADDDGYVMAMAELGCVRYCLELVADDALPTKDRAFYLKKAKAMGYAHRLAAVQRARAKPDAPTPSETPAADIDAAPPPPEPSDEGGVETAASNPPATDEVEATAPAPVGSRWTLGAGLGAFLASGFFAIAAFHGAWLASEGSRALAAAGRALPGVGQAHDLVFAAGVVIFGVLPALASYRARVVGAAAVIGAAGAAGGFWAHPVEPLLWSPAAQAGAAGLGAMLSALLVLGLVGGTRARPRRG